MYRLYSVHGYELDAFELERWKVFAGLAEPTVFDAAQKELFV
jgi:hypothetical protein